MPNAVKQALMAKARERGCGASAVLREFVDLWLAGTSPTEAQPVKRYFDSNFSAST